MTTLDELLAAKRIYDAQVASYKRTVDAKYKALTDEILATLGFDWKTRENGSLVSACTHEVSGFWTLTVYDMDPRYAVHPGEKVLGLGVSDTVSELAPEVVRRWREILTQQMEEHTAANLALGRPVW